MPGKASKNEITVLTGAVVSPQLRTRQGDEYEEKCPWCSGCGHFNHVSWECQMSPVLIYLPPIPNDPLTCRFGWGDETVLTVSTLQLCEI